MQPQVAKSSKLAIRNSLGGKKYAKISKKSRDLCFFGLLPQDDQVQQDDLIGARVGVAKTDGGWEKSVEKHGGIPWDESAEGC